MSFLLPQLMVAPNGARRSKADHPRLPISIAETVATASACFDAGAGALHAHIRNDDGSHSLDHGRYRELLREMQREVPQMPVQITTESAGLFAPTVQRDLLCRLSPVAASVAIREMLSDGELPSARHSYHAAAEAGTAIQHILYDRDDIRLLRHSIDIGTIPSDALQALLVMGAYEGMRPARPADLAPLLGFASDLLPESDIAICAFGSGETVILRRMLALGGKVRVGFENNIHSMDGTPAPDNAARVTEILGG
ncbi:MAG: 3-keto-5-aminohexanoate cleavage protein [Rhodobacteraceae bacterium]|nr:3-keto-5-aminohexanoate cleavage protein [Paracoccaceae bacterium]